MVAFLGGDVEAVPGVPTRRVLCLAAKLTRTPATMQEGDIDALRQVGFSDAAIHDVVSVVAYFNFVNRMAVGLGVELEPETPKV